MPRPAQHREGWAAMGTKLTMMIMEDKTIMDGLKEVRWSMKEFHDLCHMRGLGASYKTIEQVVGTLGLPIPNNGERHRQAQLRKLGVNVAGASTGFEERVEALSEEIARLRDRVDGHAEALKRMTRGAGASYYDGEGIGQ